MNTREELINFIIQYAGDEIETKNDALKLAKMSIKELKNNVENIKQYYRDNNLELLLLL